MTMTKQIKSLPYSNEYEQAVLGAVLYDPAKFEDLAVSLVSEDFYNPEHQKIFAEMKRIHSRHDVVDMIALSAVADTEYIANLAAASPNISNFDFYISRLKSLSVARDFVQKCGEYQNDLVEKPYEVESAISGMMHDLQAYSFGDQGFVNSIADEMSDGADELREARE